MLVRVDGHTQQETYVENLAALGDVVTLLDSLLTQGYLEIVTTESVESIAKPVKTIQRTAFTPSIERQRGVDTTTAALESAFKLAGIRYASAPQAKEPLRSGAEPQTRFQNSTASSMFTAPATRPGAPPSTAQYQLRNAISLMSDFVTAHLPADSIEIVLTLEGLSSVEKVLASLNDYKVMIATAGSAVAPHLEELRALLARR